jgi:hypothetical protein
MPPPRVVGVAVRGVERGAGEALAAGFAVLRQEIGPQAIDQMSKGRLLFARIEGRRRPLVARAFRPAFGRWGSPAAFALFALRRVSP